MQTIALINKFSTYFSDTSAESSSQPETSQPETNNSSYSSSRFKIKKFKRFIKNSKVLPLAIVGVVVFIIVIFALKNVTQSPASKESVMLARGGRVDAKNVSAFQLINKQFNFPIKDQTGKEVSKLKFIVQNAETRDELIVKGQRGTAVPGKTFLVLNIKIVNDFEKPVQINVRDYVRLTINNSNEKLSPEIHNDPVEVQAISTKYTRAAFPIEDNATGMSLLIGEITGVKETIKLDL